MLCVHVFWLCSWTGHDIGIVMVAVDEGDKGAQQLAFLCIVARELCQTWLHLCSMQQVFAIGSTQVQIHLGSCGEAVAHQRDPQLLKQPAISKGVGTRSVSKGECNKGIKAHLTASSFWKKGWSLKILCCFCVG